jgi:hypothetical protein
MALLKHGNEITESDLFSIFVEKQLDNAAVVTNSSNLMTPTRNVLLIFLSVIQVNDLIYCW